MLRGWDGPIRGKRQQIRQNEGRKRARRERLSKKPEKLPMGLTMINERRANQ